MGVAKAHYLCKHIMLCKDHFLFAYYAAQCGRYFYFYNLSMLDTTKTGTSTLISFPAVSLRRIENTLESEGRTIYMSIVDIRNLPAELEDWRRINPRDPNLKSNVSKSIAKSLSEAPQSFVFKNRGITLLAERLTYDNATSMLEVVMSDDAIHGLLDGGHTYEVIRCAVEEAKESESGIPDACVKVEILTGITDSQEAVSIVEARNTSTQVKNQSLEELRGNYEMIKSALASQTYADHIAYKENEFMEDDSKKDIDVKEVLSYLLCFDVERFGNDNHPIMSYSSKGAVVEEVKNRREEIKKYTCLLPTILTLRDRIYKLLPEAYNKSDGGNGKFGRLTGVKYVENKARMHETDLRFINETSGYRIPDAFIYPILGAFRYLVEVKGEQVTWKTDPIVLFEELQGELGKRIVERALEFRNPTKLGKDNATWQSCFDCVRMAYLEKMSK